MAWRETCPMNEKVKFIADWQSKEFTMAALCRQYNISRKTGYKILARYDEEGVDGLKEQSRAHHCHPDKIDKLIIRELLVVKKRFPKWGPKKIKRWLQEIGQLQVRLEIYLNEMA